MKFDLTRRLFGRTGISIPPIVFGTSALGNLYEAHPYERKLAIAREWFANVAPPVVLDSAGKYGAGLALETIGRVMEDLEVDPSDVILSNKLGWKRVPLAGAEPTFERGVWKEIGHDAVSSISYDGILECWEQGNKLLGGRIKPGLVSVHDPEEYVAFGADQTERTRRFEDVLEAYRALAELRDAGEVSGVGVGSKDWQMIRRISEHIDLDWVMLACSLTIHTHPEELIGFVADLAARGIGVVNSAVFNGGFLTGSDYFDYRKVARESEPELYRYRDSFFSLCDTYGVKPAQACIEFALAVPGTVAVALNTANPARVRENVEAVVARASEAFWTEMKERELVRIVPGTTGSSGLIGP